MEKGKKLIRRASRVFFPTEVFNSVDLTAASNVHLIEPHWNPAIEAQAVDRVHRKGQTHPVTVTRYIVPNSIETVSRYS